MRSIRRNLALRVGGAALALLLVGGVAIYAAIHRSLAHQFDNALATKAQALVTASEIEGGKLEIDLDVQAFAGFGSSAPGDYFEVFGSDGTAVERSPSLGRADLAKPHEFDTLDEGFSDIVLPDGAEGRAYWKRYTPSIDDDEEDEASPEPIIPPRLAIFVASDTAPLRRTLRTIAILISSVGGASVLATLAVLLHAVKAGLQPLDALSAEVHRIDVRRLAQRLPVEALPAELRGVAAKLNELLERLEISFEREKRFTSDAAHELRTPLAELRVMTELATRWPDEFTAGHGSEMLAALAELESLINALSLLAKADAGRFSGGEPIDLPTTVAEATDRVRETARSRSIDLSVAVEPGDFRCDPALWRTILGNLLENAVAYAPEGTRVDIAVSPAGLSVENDAPELTPDDLDRLFERFWRKSASRSDKGHSGLGLSLVKASVEVLGGTCEGSLHDRRLRIEVTWPA